MSVDEAIVSRRLVVTIDLAAELKPSVGLRNVLTRAYVEVDLTRWQTPSPCATRLP